MVSPLVSRDDTDRRLCMNAIGPVWDGNEVWLLVAGGATFAAFPLWYASLFSGAYLALFLVLMALIVRGISFEFRGKFEDRRWRRVWDIANFAGSLVAALVWGVAFTNFAHGLPLSRAGYTGGLFGLLNPLALVGGLAAVCIFAFHGSVFLALKTSGELRAEGTPHGPDRRARRGRPARCSPSSGWPLVGGRGRTSAERCPGVAAAAAGAGRGRPSRRRRAPHRSGPGRGSPSSATGAAVLLAVGAVWSLMYPMAIPASSGAVVPGVPGVTIGLAASHPYTLTVMTIVAAIFTPIVLLYQGWTYWVFRRRLERPADAPSPIPAAGGR